MFERLIDFLIDVWEQLLPLDVINEYESGVIVRLGKFNRYACTGLCWKIPFFEQVLSVNSVVTTMQLSSQSLHTQDDVAIVLTAIVKYKIKDVKPILLDVCESRDVLNDVALGAIKYVITTHNYTDIKNVEREREAARLVRKEVNKFGVTIDKITFSTIGRIKSLRIIM